MKYWLQTQAPAGNWVDSLGTDDLESALSHSDYLQDRGEKTRIVAREDKVINAKRKKAVRKNPLSAHAAAIMGNPGKRSTKRKARKGEAKLAYSMSRAKADYIELRDAKGTVYGRFFASATSTKDLKAFARILAQQHGVTISAHRVKRAA